MFGSPHMFNLVKFKKKESNWRLLGKWHFRFWLGFPEGFLVSPYQMGRSVNNPAAQVLGDREHQHVSSRSKFILIQSRLLPLVAAFLAVPAPSLKGPFFIFYIPPLFSRVPMRRPAPLYISHISRPELATSTGCALVFECVVQRHESTYVSTGPALTSPIQTAIAIVHPLIVDQPRGLQRLLFLGFVCVQSTASSFHPLPLLLVLSCSLLGLFELPALVPAPPLAYFLSLSPVPTRPN